MFAGLLMLLASSAAVPAAAGAAGPFPQAGAASSVDAGTLEFHMLGDTAVVTRRLANGTAVPLRAVVDVPDALAVLADPRLAFAWPALLAWAGPDLTALRDRALARSRSAFEAGLLGSPPVGQTEQWAGAPGLSALLHYARVLAESGQAENAIALLRGELAKTPVGRNHVVDRVFLTIRLAGILFEHGDQAAAIAMLETAAGDPALAGDYRINLDVNLARLLAHVRSGARALPIVDAAWRSFDEKEAGEDAIKVPDSAATFASIKACALDQLGQRDRARELMDGIVPVPALPMRPSASRATRLDAYICMGDADALAREIATQLQTALPGDNVFRFLQPADHEDARERAVVTAALSRPVLAHAVASGVRLLPPTFASALSGWSTPPAPSP